MQNLCITLATPKEQQKQWAQETHDFIEDLWLSENGGLMGISLVSSTRFNHDPILAEVWKDIVYGFRELTSQECKNERFSLHFYYYKGN